MSIAYVTGVHEIQNEGRVESIKRFRLKRPSPRPSGPSPSAVASNILSANVATPAIRRNRRIHGGQCGKSGKKCLLALRTNARGNRRVRATASCHALSCRTASTTDATKLKTVAQTTAAIVLVPAPARSARGSDSLADPYEEVAQDVTGTRPRVDASVPVNLAVAIFS